mmetsp:Transcript_11299/g.15509  ORF Transcript_11299/g.15509 Transcript_11299/m.15509 type:complete len:480 (+) Transcript_11299:102-1541(+)
MRRGVKISFNTNDAEKKVKKRGKKKISPTLEWLWSTVLVFGTVFVLSSFILTDLVQGGLGTSNGRVVSFLNSLNAMASFRRQRRVLQSGDAKNSPNSEKKKAELLYLRATRNSWSHRIQLFLLMFLAKFGSQSLGSLLIGATPVILKGPRHTFSWLLAMACIQLFPRDSVYKKLYDHSSLLCLVRIGCALYKLRKFNFVSAFSLSKNYSLPWMLFVQIIIIDGNNLTSRISTWAWLRGWRHTSPNDLVLGLITLIKRILPIALASTLFFISTFHLLSLNFFSFFLEFVIKLFVFLLFLLRYDVHILAIKSTTAFMEALPIIANCFINVSSFRDTSIHFEHLLQKKQDNTLQNNNRHSIYNHKTNIDCNIPPILAPGFSLPAAACSDSNYNTPSQRSSRADLRRRLVSNEQPQRSQDSNDISSFSIADYSSSSTRRLLRMKRSLSWQHLTSPAATNYRNEDDLASSSSRTSPNIHQTKVD